MTLFKRSRFASPVSAVVLLFLASFTPPASAADDRGEAKIDVGGKSISVEYGRPSTEGEGYQSMKEGVPEGFIWRMGSNAATTLKTEVDLMFGDVKVAAGEYSLAALKTKEGWNLLVHPDPKRRGTGKVEDYTASIPFKVGEPKEAAELLTIRLREKDGKGRLALIWGSQRLTVPFTVSK